jgi:hypothetical protein
MCLPTACRCSAKLVAQLLSGLPADKLIEGATAPRSVHLRLLPDQFAAIDAWIKRQIEPDLSRPEAIRRLVELGLKANGNDGRLLIDGIPALADCSRSDPSGARIYRVRISSKKGR